MAAIRRTWSRPAEGGPGPARLAGCRCSCERLHARPLHSPVWQLRLTGPVVAEEPAELVDAVVDLAGSAPVLIDLTEATVVRPEAVGAALERAADPTEPCFARVAVVCPRPTGRRLLRRSAPTSAAVFSTQGDALQALIMAGSGLGAGWAPESAMPPRPGHLRLV